MDGKLRDRIGSSTRHIRKMHASGLPTPSGESSARVGGRGDEQRARDKVAWVLALHGGAAQGYFSEKGKKKYKKVMLEASHRAAALLNAGGSAVDAVKLAVEVLENEATANAGYGSNLTLDGTVECDASIMSGEDMAFGAVGAAPGIKNPIAAAAALLYKGRQGLMPLGRVPPLMLVGEGARRWCEQEGLQVAAEGHSEMLVSKEARARWQDHATRLQKYLARSSRATDASQTMQNPAAKGSSSIDLKTSSSSEASAGQGLGGGGGAGKKRCGNAHALHEHDTVGAVCLDAHGHVAAAVSSGGISLKLPGRVGEAALFGCGCYALDSWPLSGGRAQGGSGSRDEQRAAGTRVPWGKASQEGFERGVGAGLGKRGAAFSVTGTGEEITKRLLASSCAAACAQPGADPTDELHACMGARPGEWKEWHDPSATNGLKS